MRPGLILGWMSGFIVAVNACAGLKDADCLECHSDRALSTTNSAGRAVSLFVDAARLAGSVHQTNSCISCHSDISERHPDDNLAARPVNCGGCHQRRTASFAAGVHRRSSDSGVAGAATCRDCHGSHDVTFPTSPLSPLNVGHQADTCGACHEQEAKEWAASVHGTALAAGKRDAPACADCHSEHGIAASGRGVSLQSSQGACSRCHASERLNVKYNLPDDRVRTFFGSYHGLALQYGSTVAANCGSCHGYHKILPSTDPASTIHPAHLVQTCGKCHPGATEKFALGKIHVNLEANSSAGGLGERINWWVRKIYLTLIFGVVGAMFVHNALLFLKKFGARLRSSAPTVVRMDRCQRWQHAALGICFVVLAVTGFALKFPDTWLARLLGSSEALRSCAHRIAGVGLLVVGVWHVIYLNASREGRRLWFDVLPVKQDLMDVWGTVCWSLGLRRTKPPFGRFSYAEKMEYWAVIWGTLIMGISGLMVWSKMEVTQWLPRWVVDVALTIHYYEAILACLAILVWHFYHVIFDPDVYPLNTACLHGHVPQAWHKHEHGLETTKPPMPEKAKTEGANAANAAAT